jgi:hypothetical protein
MDYFYVWQYYIHGGKIILIYIISYFIVKNNHKYIFPFIPPQSYNI